MVNPTEKANEFFTARRAYLMKKNELLNLIRECRTMDELKQWRTALADYLATAEDEDDFKITLERVELAVKESVEYKGFDIVTTSDGYCVANYKGKDDKYPMPIIESDMNAMKQHIDELIAVKNEFPDFLKRLGIANCEYTITQYVNGEKMSLVERLSNLIRDQRKLEAFRKRNPNVDEWHVHIKYNVKDVSDELFEKVRKTKMGENVTVCFGNGIEITAPNGEKWMWGVTTTDGKPVF